MKDNLGYEIKDNKTFFTLKEGTVFKLGQSEIELAEDAEFCMSGSVGRDGIVGLLIAGGQAGENSENFAHTIYRTVGGKRTAVEVSYGGVGETRYRVAGADGRSTESLPGEAIEGETAEAIGAPAENISEGVSAGAGVALTTKEAGKLDNPLESMKSDAQLMQEFGAAKDESKKGKSKSDGKRQ